MPRTEEQNEQLREQRREEILLAALKVFAKRGFAATKMSDIAKEAQLSHGLVYHYYKSKEEIFTLLVQQANESSVRIIDEAQMRIGSPLEKIEWMTAQIFSSFSSGQQILLFFIMIQASTSEAIPEDVKIFLNSPEFQSPVHRLVPLISEGQQCGEIILEDPLKLAVTYYAFIQGFAIQKLQWHKGPMPEVKWILKLLR